MVARTSVEYSKAGEQIIARLFFPLRQKELSVWKNVILCTHWKERCSLAVEYSRIWYCELFYFALKIQTEYKDRKAASIGYSAVILKWCLSLSLFMGARCIKLSNLHKCMAYCVKMNWSVQFSFTMLAVSDRGSVQWDWDNESQNQSKTSYQWMQSG